MVVGRLLDDRRPLRRRAICSRACVSLAISFMPLSADADIASRKARRRVRRFTDRRRSLGTAFSPTLKPKTCDATFRVAISNSRLLRFEGNEVTFRYKNYRRSGADRQQVMTIAANEFIRRFLLHVLPRGFHRIRHYGLLAGSSRKDSLAQARELLGVAPAPEEPPVAETPDQRPPCPCCGGTMVIIESFAAWCQPRAPPTARAPNREHAHDPA